MSMTLFHGCGLTLIFDIGTRGRSVSYPEDRPAFSSPARTTISGKLFKPYRQGGFMENSSGVKRSSERISAFAYGKHWITRAVSDPVRVCVAFLLCLFCGLAAAGCRFPTPAAVPFDKGSARDSCPSGYYSSGSICSPSGSSAKFVLIKPSSGSGCPSNYYSSGSFCVADSQACHAFLNPSGSCPSGYYRSHPWCVSN